MNIKQKLKLSGIFILLCLFTSLSRVSHAQTPQLLNYQGYVVDGVGSPITGNHTFDFTIYDTGSGGSALWSESLSVNVENGYFSVLLGESTALDPGVFSSGALYLGISIDAGAEMSPRQRIVSSAFAIQSNTTENADWNGIANLPTGFADGVDNDTDTLDGLSCAEGEVAKMLSGVWTCSVP